MCTTFGYISSHGLTNMPWTVDLQPFALIYDNAMGSGTQPRVRWAGLRENACDVFSFIWQSFLHIYDHSETDMCYNIGCALFMISRHVLKNGESVMVQHMVNEYVVDVTTKQRRPNDRTAKEIFAATARENAMPSFNYYRRHLGLSTYIRSYELTGN